MAFWNADPTTSNGAQGVDANQQQDFINALQAQAHGMGPSAAALMLQQQARQAAAQQYAQAAATRGVNPALALRDAQIQGNAAMQNADAQAGIQRTQEQLDAQHQIGSNLATMRGQDINNDLGQQGLLNNANQFNAGQNSAVAGGVASGVGSALESGLGVAGLTGLGVLGGGKPKTPTDASGAPDYENNFYSGSDNGFGSDSTGNYSGEGAVAAKGGKVAQGRVMPPRMADGGPVQDFFTPTITPATPGFWKPTYVGGTGNGNGVAIGVAPGAPQWIPPTPSSQTLAGPLSPLYRPGGSSLMSSNAAIPNTTQSGTGQPNHIMMASGGVASFTPDSNPSDPTGPQSQIGRFLQSGGTDVPPTPFAKGGAVPNSLVSPGERYLSPKAVKEVEQGKKSPMKAGEKIPGRAKVGGAVNSYANDFVPKTLQEGGIVLPRSVTKSKDPAREAHKFVKALLARQGGLGK